MPDSPPPPQAAADGHNNPNPASSSAGGRDPSPLSPPAALSGEAAAATAAGRNPSSPSRPALPGGSSIYDLFLTAVGLTPRELAADTFSQGGSAGQAEEQDFWSAHEGGEENNAGAGGADYGSGSSMPAAAHQRDSSAGTASATGTAGGEGGHLAEPQQLPVTTNGQVVSRDSGATPAAAVVSAPAAPQTGAHSRPGERPTTRTRQQLLSEADIERRYPGGDSDGQAGSTSLEAATAAPGTARRRRRLFGSNTAAASESGAR